MILVFLPILNSLEENALLLALKSHHFFLGFEEQLVALKVDHRVVLFDMASQYLSPAIDLYDLEDYLPELVDRPLVALFLVLALADLVDGEQALHLVAVPLHAL